MRSNNIRYRHPRRIKASFPMDIYVAMVTCPKCEHNRAFFMQIQTRSVDEQMTTFYKCCSMTCAHQWRD
ncbi:hypothetical protein SNE40_023549 [Patella caerulea]|uniref:DNA-directed RNA polymerase III subunit RPC10 n=1 Tax=Patella caerulea TaxID=87958 RepID=A0AAN8J470_PATCE